MRATPEVLQQILDAYEELGGDGHGAIGWEHRTRPFDYGEIQAVLIHHTGTKAKGDFPSRDVLVNGRSGLPGPLSQFAMTRSGALVIIGHGWCNHAGAGEWPGVDQPGNAHTIGIEVEHDGVSVWPEALYRATVRFGQAVQTVLGPDIPLIGHKEWATPHGRKIDPNFDMNEWREDVATNNQGAPVAFVTPNKQTTIWMQEILVAEGYDLGPYGPNKDGIDGDPGPKTQAAWADYTSDPSKVIGSLVPRSALDQCEDVVRQQVKLTHDAKTALVAAKAISADLNAANTSLEAERDKAKAELASDAAGWAGDLAKAETERDTFRDDVITWQTGFNQMTAERDKAKADLTSATTQRDLNAGAAQKLTALQAGLAGALSWSPQP